MIAVANRNLHRGETDPHGDQPVATAGPDLAAADAVCTARQCESNFET